MPSMRITRQKVLGLTGHTEQYGRSIAMVKSGKGLQESLAEIMKSISFTEISSTVVSIGPRLSNKRHEEKFRWEPTQAHVGRGIRDIWPKRKADRMSEAKGISQKRPPLTSDARQATRRAPVSGKSQWRSQN
jgi:hypothetical protein